MLALGTAGRIWVCVAPQDGRKSFDGLRGVVVNHLAQDPLSGDLYVFRNKRGDRLKILAWMGDGFALYVRRLEKGTFRFPDAAGAEVRITARYPYERRTPVTRLATQEMVSLIGIAALLPVVAAAQGLTRGGTPESDRAPPVNSAPQPGSLETVMRPPCPTMISRAIANPIPTLPERPTRKS